MEIDQEVEKLRGLVGDTQDFLKHLIAGKSQYYFRDKLMANGMAHAKELRQKTEEALKELVLAMDAIVCQDWQAAKRHVMRAKTLLSITSGGDFGTDAAATTDD